MLEAGMAILNDTKGLESKLRARTQERIRQQTDEKALTAEEIERVSGLSTKLVSDEVLLSERDNDELRALASLSRIALKPPSQIASHRKFIGPIIVFFKKLTYPLVAFHMKETIEGLEESASLSVSRQAKLASELKRQSS